MKLELDVPVWYSREALYASKVKSSDFIMTSDCVDISKDDADLGISSSSMEEFRAELSQTLSKEIESWFSSPLTSQQIEKRLQFQFPAVACKTEERWVKATWVPDYFQVQKKAFILIFKLFKITACNPRIPITFLEAMTPRATTPTEPIKEQVRNIILQPGAGPDDLQQIDDIPLSETLTSLEIRDEKAREKQRLREAKLRAAIARLKVEEMRERYLRQYGGEYFEESSDSEEETSSLNSELSEPVHKK